jgi:hypothetical protein
MAAALVMKTAPTRHRENGHVVDLRIAAGIRSLKRSLLQNAGPPTCCASTAAGKRRRGPRCATIGPKSYLERLAATRSAAWLRSISSPGSCAVNI